MTSDAGTSTRLQLGLHPVDAGDDALDGRRGRPAGGAAVRREVECRTAASALGELRVRWLDRGRVGGDPRGIGGSRAHRGVPVMGIELRSGDAHRRRGRCQGERQDDRRDHEHEDEAFHGPTSVRAAGPPLRPSAPSTAPLDGRPDADRMPHPCRVIRSAASLRGLRRPGRGTPADRGRRRARCRPRGVTPEESLGPPLVQPAAAYCSRKNASRASAARLSTRVLERTV